MKLFSRRSAPVALALTVGLVIGTAGLGNAAGSGTPANKVTAAGSNRVVFGPGTEVTILSATMKTSKPTDLILQLTMECSILTALTTGNDTPSGTASASIRAWIEIDGVVVPVTSISSPPQSPPPPGDKAKDSATMCNRTYSRTVTDGEDPLDGIDTEDDYIDTKSANGFNWLRQNTGSGMHTIVVKATLTETISGANANAQAEIGNRTLIVEPTKMANDAVIAESGTS